MSKVKKKTESVDPIQAITAGIEPLQGLFDKLTIPKRLEIEDAFGNTYSASGKATARKQMTVSAVLHTVIQDPGLAEIRAEGMARREAGEPNMSLLIWAMTQVVLREDLCAHLDAVWTAIHPKIVDQARAHAKAEGEVGESVADLFDVGALIEGVLPFFAHSGRKILGTVQTMTAQPVAAG